MKRCILAFLIACLFANAFAQEAPGRLAIYVYGASDPGINKSLGNKLLAAFVQSGKYAEIANSEAFYEDIAKNGNSQIAQTAKQHGADYVCMVSIAEAFGSYSISARMVRTSDLQVIKIGSADRSLKSLDDLTAVSNELAIQFLPPGSQAAPLPLAANAQAAAQKQCIIMFNINEILFKIKNGFTNQLKDCSSKLAKEMVLAASPFGKKAAAPEPKAFMKQCAVDWVRKEIADEFPSKDKLVGSVDNFVQGILATASAGGTLDPKKLISTVGRIDIEGLLGDIKRLARGECVIDVLYEPPSPPTPAAPIGRGAESEYMESNSYKNFTAGQRWGTWALNAFTISGLGSWVVMGDVLGGYVHFGFGTAALVSALVSYVYSSGGELSRSRVDDWRKIGSVFLFSGGIWNIYRSITYDKPQSVASGKYEGFNFTVLPNRRGELVPYFLYSKAF